MIHPFTALKTDDGKTYPSASRLAGYVVLTALLCFMLVPVSLQAAGTAAPSSGYAMPEMLGAKSRKRASREEQPAKKTEQQALDNNKPDAATVASEEPVKVEGPAEKAAARARAFLQSKEAKGIAAGDKGGKRVGDTTVSASGAEQVENTLNIAEPVVPSGKLNFTQCVHLALKQSPYLVETAMEVQLRRIDESDSMWNLLPKFKVATSYVIADPDQEYQEDERWDINFLMESWDPIEAGLSIMASQEITKIAILAHMKVINEGLKQLGELFIGLGSIEQMIAIQDELISVSQHQKTFLTNLLDSGSANPLEVRIADQRVEMAILEREQMLAKRDELKENLKTFLGIGEGENLELDLADASNQVHGYFSPSEISVENIKDNSIDMKIESQKRKLAEYQISLAWAAYIPRLKFGFRTPDVVDSDKDTNDGFYTTIGFEWQFWDWGERYRNVRRERLEARKAIASENITGMSVSSDWRTTITRKRSSLAALKVNRALVELAGLRKRQGEISYQAGTQPFPEYLDTIKAYFEARKKAVTSEMDDDMVMLDLRYISGDLFNAYISAKEI